MKNLSIKHKRSEKTDASLFYCSVVAFVLLVCRLIFSASLSQNHSKTNNTTPKMTHQNKPRQIRAKQRLRQTSSKTKHISSITLSTSDQVSLSWVLTHSDQTICLPTYTFSVATAPLRSRGKQKLARALRLDLQTNVYPQLISHPIFSVWSSIQLVAPSSRNICLGKSKFCMRFRRHNVAR